MEVLIGNKSGFLKSRLKNYSTDRNNPLKPKALSGLSPYLHFGQISTQRCALEAKKVRNLYPQVCQILTCISCGNNITCTKVNKKSCSFFCIRSTEICFFSKFFDNHQSLYALLSCNCLCFLFNMTFGKI